MAVFDILLSNIQYILIILLLFVLYKYGVHTVPQEQAYIVERFKKYNRTLNSGLNFIIPFIDKKSPTPVHLRENRKEDSKFELFTKDNVEIYTIINIFWRISDPEKSYYRIGKDRNDVEKFIEAAVKGVVRSIVGNQLLDEVQRNGELINAEIKKALSVNADEWGVVFTRTEITDVDVDEKTKAAQRQEIEAERRKRAQILDAEGKRREIEQIADGKKREVELEADAILYKAQKEADAKKITADADAYAIQKQAEAIENNGQAAVSFEILKKQVQAISEVASSQNSKTIILPTDITKVLGTFETVLSSINKKK